MAARLSGVPGLLLAVLTASPSAALVITAPVQPPPEPCTEERPSVFPPGELLACPVRPNGVDENCRRLMPRLRQAAETRDAKEILVRAAFEYYVLRRPELHDLYPGSPPASPSLPFAQALADLAVTGRDAYASFRQLAPRETDLVGPLQDRLRAIFPSHRRVPGDIGAAVHQALHRAYRVAWALRGPTSHRQAERAALRWIAVDGEDDPPHRPVNVASAPFPQYNMTVKVNSTLVETRYVVASREITDDYPADLREIPPDRALPLIIGDIVLFIHGHSSSLEEAMPLTGPLLARAARQGRPLTVIAMDLPSNGYSSMIEHTTIAAAQASSWNTAYPILDFIEQFIVAFVDQLEARQPGLKSQIVGVIGGSLGGNMTLRLGQRDPALRPWLHSIVSWSAASTWPSWARAVNGPAGPGQYYDLVRHGGTGFTRSKMVEAERVDSENGLEDSLFLFFHETASILGPGIGRMAQAERWYRLSWECRESAMTASHLAVYEIYNARFRRWHWRVAHEQLIFSHWDSNHAEPGEDPDPRINPAAGPARYAGVRARVLLASGQEDNGSPEKIFDETRVLAGAMTMVRGTTLFLQETGHSIHIERPVFFADKVLDFLFETPPPPLPYFLIPGIAF